MPSVSALREKFERYAQSYSLRFKLEMTDYGLLLGADTIVLPADKRSRNCTSDDAGDSRLSALLSAAYKRRIASGVMTSLRQASTQWTRGQKSRARIHLISAHLPRLESREDALRASHPAQF